MEQTIIQTPEGYKKVTKEENGKTVISFEKVESELPKKWELEDSKIYWFIEGDSEIVDYGHCETDNSTLNALPSKELAEAMLTLCQLLVMRDRYNSIEKEKKGCYYAIHRGGCCEICCCTLINDLYYPLYFYSEKLCEEFYNNFKDLIEIAKPLL